MYNSFLMINDTTIWISNIINFYNISNIIRLEILKDEESQDCWNNNLVLP